MDDISNRTLAIFLLTAIIVSLGATVHVLNQVSPGVTGRATTDQGNVSLDVSTTVSIILNTDVVDFGSGYVNTSKDACGNNATLRAGPTYTDSGGNDCWTASNTPGPLLLENDGNRNATVVVTGPKELDFFAGYVGSFEYNLSWKVRQNETGNPCNEIPAGADSYKAFNGTQAVCDNLDYYVSGETGGGDEIAIDIEVKIPADLDSGTYENATITFTAAEAT